MMEPALNPENDSGRGTASTAMPRPRHSAKIGQSQTNDRSGTPYFEHQRLLTVDSLWSLEA